MASPLYKLRLEVVSEVANAIAEAIEPFVDSVVWTAEEDDPIAVIIGIAQMPPDRAAIDQSLRGTAAAFGIAVPALQVETLAQRDWLAANKIDFPPIEQGRFFIHTAEYDGVIPKTRIALRIPPAGAFGSGKHGSTQGCLAALDDLRKLRGGPVLDMGCGSGILALAAAKVWRRETVCADIDPRAVEETLSNARANKIVTRLHGVTARGYRHEIVLAQRYALIFANILAKPLTGMTNDTVRALLPGGIVILSGLLESDGPWVTARHRALGLTLRRRYHVEGWLTLVMEKPYGYP